VTDRVAGKAHQAATLETYRLLVPTGLDVIRHFSHAGGPLTEAVFSKDVEWITFLLESGADPRCHQASSQVWGQKFKVERSYHLQQ
jgi:hypothetical protein